MTEIVTVQKEGLRIDMCALIITNYESPECPEDLTNSSSFATTSPTEENIKVYAIVGGVIGGIVGLFAVVVLVSTVVVLSLRWSRSQSGAMKTEEAE